MLEWLEFTPLALWVKESWGWPFALTLHAFGSAIIVGFAFIMCLCLFGMFQTIPLASLMSLVPYIWVCLGLQAFSGFLLWLTKPERYLEAAVFGVKLAMIVTGFVTTLYFQKTLRRKPADGLRPGRSPRAVSNSSPRPRWSGLLFSSRGA